MEVGCGLSLFFSTAFYVGRISSRWMLDHRLDASDIALTAALITCWGVDILMLWCKRLNLALVIGN